MSFKVVQLSLTYYTGRHYIVLQILLDIGFVFMVDMLVSFVFWFCMTRYTET